MTLDPSFSADIQWVDFFVRRREGEPSAPQSSSLDLPLLLELFDGNRDSVAALLQAGIASIFTDLQTIERCLDGGDSQTLLQAVHRLKGTSGSIGASELIERSVEIETSVTSGVAVAPPVVRELRRAVEDVQRQITAFAQAGG